MSKINILLVDENKVQREVLASALNMAQFDCFQVHTSAGALEAFEQNKFNLAIIYHNMKPFNGIETITYIRDTHDQASLPIILVVEKRSPHIEEAVKDLGVARIVEREANRNPLIKVIKEVLKVKN